MTGVGFTVIVNVPGVPTHAPLIVGVTVIVAVIEALVELAAVKAGTFPVPLAANPIAVFEFIHV